MSGNTDDHEQPTSSVNVQEGPASTIHEQWRVVNYMQPRSGGSNSRNRNSANSKSKETYGQTRGLSNLEVKLQLLGSYHARSLFFQKE